MKSLESIAVELAAGVGNPRDIDEWASHEVATNSDADTLVFELLSVDDESKKRLFQNIVEELYGFELSNQNNLHHVERFLHGVCQDFLSGSRPCEDLCECVDRLVRQLGCAAHVPAGLYTLLDACAARHSSWYRPESAFTDGVKDAMNELEECVGERGASSVRR